MPKEAYQLMGLVVTSVTLLILAFYLQDKAFTAGAIGLMVLPHIKQLKRFLVDDTDKEDK